MTDEMKLLVAMCDALGFEVEVDADYQRSTTNHVIDNGGVVHQYRRMITETLSTKFSKNREGLYMTELIKPLISYKLIPKTKDDWIPVSERLPITEDDMDNKSYMDIEVIVTDGESVEFGSFQAGNTSNFWSCFVTDIYSSIVDSTVTHWMPLPPKPTDTKQED